MCKRFIQQLRPAHTMLVILPSSLPLPARMTRLQRASLKSQRLLVLLLMSFWALLNYLIPPSLLPLLPLKLFLPLPQLPLFLAQAKDQLLFLLLLLLAGHLLGPEDGIAGPRSTLTTASVSTISTSGNTRDWSTATQNGPRANGALPGLHLSGGAVKRPLSLQVLLLL